MKCKIEKSRLSGNIVCPPNKSYSHRALFLATLAKGKSTLRNVLLSRDTIATLDACKSFGAKIDTTGDKISVEGNGEIIPQTNKIDASNSGTTIRIAAAISSLSNSTITLVGDSSLQKRPMQPLLDALKQLGAHCDSTNGRAPISIKGKAVGGTATISGSVSSQFISALLIAGPLMKNG